MISVLILARNEELDLPGCLASVAWSDDVHVFDSFSTDTTAEIARSAGAQLHQRVFDDYATHRNAALQIAFAHPWVLILDADERPTPSLCAEMQSAVERVSTQLSGFRLRRRDFLFNTWLKHAQISPFYIRLVRPERAHYTRPVNEVIEVDGQIGELREPLDHFPFSKGIAHWIAKHNVYSTMEAQLIAQGSRLLEPSLGAALRHPDFHTRRLHQKALFYRLPARPLLKWLYMVVVRRSFLDGRAGMTYATLQAIYEYFIVLKTNELKKSSENQQ
jgi:glycosyltransferase involved in cell wall biosynthesis